jgi:tetratricopeptide (TPR) repeat protein
MQMENIQPPEQIAEEGKRLYQQGDFLKAAELFASAAQEYTARNDALMTAEMKNNQCVVLLQVRRLNEALEIVTGTDAVFAEAGDYRRQGIALANRATVMDALGRWKEAVPIYRQAADALQRAGEDGMRADTLKSLSQMYMKHGRFTDAVIAMQEGLMGVKDPTPRQKLLKKLLFMRLWK